MTHFIETCNDAWTYGDYVVKQFVQSLKGNIFGWYTDLETISVDSLGQLEKEFFNRFYSTRRTINMIELINSHQRKEKSVIDYSNHRINLASTTWIDYLRSLQQLRSPSKECIVVKPKTFEELATRAHAIEITMDLDEREYLSADTNDDEQEKDEEYIALC
ncbi:hypothetical protein Sango_1905000 [Sesamum angolense]|uniref:Retrotransposon gag domain-containing protein n=1 Tax=Sesamum angolense TaxID=2727404 RepID=A0AAE1WJ63_9LAMI|nr:hypothetical protein Sango_1905000 [Sesamum angolense]